MLKKAPRAVLKSHMKKKSDIRIGKNADLMVSFGRRQKKKTTQLTLVSLAIKLVYMYALSFMN